MTTSEQVWTPSLVGYAGATMLTGISLGQVIVYTRWFPHENRLLKTGVLCIVQVLPLLRSSDLNVFQSFGDFFHEGISLMIPWIQFITCRRNLSYKCTVENTWQSLVAVPTAMLTTFCVQVFYCYRVWIVSGKNRIVTGLVAFFAAMQLISGAILTGDLIMTDKVVTLFENPYLPTSYGASAICDVIISGSMIYYLRQSRTGVRRSGNGLQRLVTVFVRMGMLTCLTAIIIAISYITQGAAYWAALPSVLLPKLYVNSMLAVLNARKTIRDNEGENLGVKIVIPTIRADQPAERDVAPPT